MQMRPEVRHLWLQVPVKYREAKRWACWRPGTNDDNVVVPVSSRTGRVMSIRDVNEYVPLDEALEALENMPQLAGVVFVRDVTQKSLGRNAYTVVNANLQDATLTTLQALVELRGGGRLLHRDLYRAYRQATPRHPISSAALGRYMRSCGFADYLLMSMRCWLNVGLKNDE